MKKLLWKHSCINTAILVTYNQLNHYNSILLRIQVIGFEILNVLYLK